MRYEISRTTELKMKKELPQLVEEYLAKGGKITELPAFVRHDTPENAKNNKAG